MGRSSSRLSTLECPPPCTRTRIWVPRTSALLARIIPPCSAIVTRRRRRSSFRHGRKSLDGYPYGRGSLSATSD
eukprot:scaffold387787_cov33-Prasinocladus_malaysianus.AAC.1